jgi:predicted nucleotidyltransferase
VTGREVALTTLGAPRRRASSRVHLDGAPRLRENAGVQLHIASCLRESARIRSIHPRRDPRAASPAPAKSAWYAHAMVSSADILATLERRAADERARAAGRAKGQLAKVDVARALLVHHGAKRAWLFGSLARGETRSDSDVDLAVEGLPASKYFAALAALMELFRGRVDLVRVEEAGESLRACIRDEGRTL